MGLKDILASKGQKGTLTEMFRHPIFANTIFTKSFNYGGLLNPFSGLGLLLPPFCAWGPVIDILVVGGSLSPFWCWGELLAPCLGLGVVSPLFIRGLLVPFSGFRGLLAPLFGVGVLLAFFGGSS